MYAWLWLHISDESRLRVQETANFATDIETSHDVKKLWEALRDKHTVLKPFHSENRLLHCTGSENLDFLVLLSK